MSASVVVTQPYVPRYRVPLFDALAAELAQRDMDLTVYSGQPDGEQAGRNDQATGAWHRDLTVRRVRVGPRQLEYRDLPHEVRTADLVVSELSGLNLEGWRLGMRRRPLVLWGHGKSYTSPGGWLSDRVEWALARRASHIMTYAPSGARFLIEEAGLDPSRVTSIGNSTDTAALRSFYIDARDAAPDTDRRPARPPAAPFIGGIDSTKRIDFVLGAFEHATAADPGFRLHVVGNGPLAPLVDDLAARDARVRRYGDLRGRSLAELAVVADAIWMPGRVGLVAVDALAMGLPVHTTDFEFHAPEVEFLQDGELLRLPDDPAAFARASLAALDGPAPELRDDIPTVQSVARNMAAVFDRVLRG